MRTEDFNYDLPQELIAQHPAERRDGSRLLVYHRGSGRVEHRVFRDIVEYLNPGDALVLNETRVIPARLLGRTAGGGAAEVFLLKDLGGGSWEAMARPGKRLKPGASVLFGDGELRAQITGVTEDGGRVVRFTAEGDVAEALMRLGETPLPPYITEKPADAERYQTVYAARAGSVAAPTAGLHFTDDLLGDIANRGVDIVKVLLHVGAGTFKPVKADVIEDHVMHAEYYRVSEESAARLNAARGRGGRIVAVGTTSARTLESAAGEDGCVAAGEGETSIFITPGYRFKAVDALITNFHLPKSTLLMMVSALMGREDALRVYGIAVGEGYRFFSFGDAMVVV